MAHSQPASPVRRVVVAAVLGCLPEACVQAATNFNFQAELSLKETFDSNVYLQDVVPDPAIPGAVQPHQHSLVTTATPRVGFTWVPCSAATISTSYAPEVNRFHAESDEDHVAHRVALRVTGDVDIVSWEQQSSFTWIDGSDEGLVFGGPGGAPAIGGIPIRDRRAAIIVRNQFRAIHVHNGWFFRPVASSYFHDFRIKYQPPFHQFYVDRNDLNTGVDFGYKITKEASVTLGYRFGFQQEPPLPGANVDYSNDYHRLLVGLEGRLTKWLKVNLALGPDYRDFNHRTHPEFDDHHTKLFVDATAAITPTAKDTVTLAVKQYEQPAFGAPSAYEDMTYDLSWRHQFCPHAGVTTGFRAYGGDWMAPVAREDWIFTASAGLNIAFNKHFSGEVGYSYDWSDSLIPNTAGREFTRHLGSVGVKYSY
ncbi:MAG: hypothetical protein FJ387_08445 [Verrucomicrobia bacterium]|nr:hypothetical protein [Verrucomicrobiota bacterium]